MSTIRWIKLSLKHVIQSVERNRWPVTRHNISVTTAVFLSFRLANSELCATLPDDLHEMSCLRLIASYPPVISANLVIPIKVLKAEKLTIVCFRGVVRRVYVSCK